MNKGTNSYISRNKKKIFFKNKKGEEKEIKLSERNIRMKKEKRKKSNQILTNTYLPTYQKPTESRQHERIAS